MALVQGRARVGIGAAVALLALVAPTAALGGHDIRIKKQEKHFTLDSDEQRVDISCASGYKVVDGMWRIDHADQDDDLGFHENYVQAADVLEAYSPDEFSYTFFFVKNAIGRVQGKVFITCIGINSEGDENHTMKPTFSPTTGAPHAGGTAAGTGLLTADTDGETNECQENWILIAPGFTIGPASEEVGQGRMVKSNLVGTDGRNWEWKVTAGNTASTLTTSFRCLKMRVDQLGSGSAPAGHRHKLIRKHKTSSPTIGTGVTTTDLSCGAAYKAIVAGFDFSSNATLFAPLLGNPSPPGAGSYASWKLWYLGMDPRPKVRSYKFFNNSGGAVSGGDVVLSATCLNYRTT